MWTRAVMACYVIWGLLPLLYAMLAPSGAAELVASRIVWGFGLCMAIVAIHGQTRAVLDILRNPRALVITAASAALLGLNWGTHIVAILTGQVVDAGIGYLLTPLLSVILGAIVLRQRLSVQQWLGVALAGAALLVIGAGYGSVPWVVLLLPLSWAIYGLVKQKFPIEAPGQLYRGAFAAGPDRIRAVGLARADRPGHDLDDRFPPPALARLHRLRHRRSAALAQRLGQAAALGDARDAAVHLGGLPGDSRCRPFRRTDVTHAVGRSRVGGRWCRRICDGPHRVAGPQGRRSRYAAVG